MSVRTWKWTLLCLAITGLQGSVVLGEVKTPSIFGSGMVLQRGVDVPVWGWAEAGEDVTVSFGDQKKVTKANADGEWQVKLSSLSVGEPRKLVVAGKNELVFDDVLVGEVWVCSGQSNMGWSVGRALDADLEALAANEPQIRLFQVPLVTAETPQEDVAAVWRVTAPDNISSFSAVGYFFGRQLHHVLNVPVGVVMTAWGGTRAEAWTSPEAMASTEELQPIVKAWDERAASYDAVKAKERYEAAMKAWTERVNAAKAAGKPTPRRPQMQGEPRKDRHHPSTLYNAMVAPLVPYAIRGAIWYQGESNANRAYQYRTLMPTMIQSWRDVWGQGDFPFYQVQLANFLAINDQPEESAWAELREAQVIAGQVIPNVGAACITDLGAAKDIHPKDKQNVAKRLARLALVDVYGLDSLVKQGPTYKSMEVKGDKVLIHFETYGSPLVSYYNEPLTGFSIAGEDHKWVWGKARIVNGTTVEVSSPEIPEPKAVRYNWANNPQGTLYSDAYLPAYPFRTDDWKGITVENVTP